MVQANHIFQGLRRDNHQIRQDSKFLWDAHNVRLTCREDSTMISLTNEQGTSEPLLSFEGNYVGHCVIGRYLIVFTAKDKTQNWIYRVERKDNGEYFKIILFSGNLNINPESPIETLGLYETELVQKVYWIDDKNSPRVINVTLPELKFSKEDYDIIMVEGTNLSDPKSCTNQDAERALRYYYPDGMWNDTSFDFIQSLKLKETVQVYKTEVSGILSPGTMQYAFTYYNKYGAETNIFYTTPLYYIAHKDRGGNPEEKISCGFTINIDNLDHFEYVRVYSIHRTSIDAVPTVKIVTDLPIPFDHTTGMTLPVTYTDNGTSGSIEDPTYLLYLGGKDIIAKAITQKSNTLFLGNITLKNNTNRFRDIVIKEPGDVVISDEPFLLDTIPRIKEDHSYYSYDKSLINYTGVFKAHETYRCGFQVQDSKGVWSEPIYMDDVVLCEGIADNALSSKSLNLTKDVVNKLIEEGVKRIRTCVVFPRTFERSRICQGVLCPTVYSVRGRKNNAPYASSSWFFRAVATRDFYGLSSDNSSPLHPYDVYKGEFIEYEHNKPLIGATTGLFTHRGVELQNMAGLDSSYTLPFSLRKDDQDSYFFVDENIVTFHSPDIEFDSNVQNLSLDNCKLEIVGVARLGAIFGDIDIQTSSPTASSTAPGFMHNTIGYTLQNSEQINGGLVSGLFYLDSKVTESGDVDNDIYSFMVYPWQKSGSINNDKVRAEEKGTQSSVLGKKTISNLKFFKKNDYIEEGALSLDITTPQLFMSDEISLLKLQVPYINSKINYYGNIDTLLPSYANYPIVTSDAGNFDNVNFNLKDTDNKWVIPTQDPIRMKYKSSPHLVMSLGKEDDKTIVLLPKIGREDKHGVFTIPQWWSPEVVRSKTVDGLLAGYNVDEGSFILGGNPEKITRYFLQYEYHIGDEPVFSLWKSVYTHAGDGTTLPLVFVKRVTEMTESLEVKIENGETYLGNYDYYIPETSKDDYNSKRIYIGETKYYNIVKKLGILHVEGLVVGLEYIDPSKGVTTEDSSSDTESIKTLQPAIHVGQMDSVETPYLLIADLVQEISDSVRFGGKSEDALRNNLWFPASEPVSLVKNKELIVPYRYGDTWYSRYDCLKTYPFTKEDENQVVEIGSFLCETRVNIDGRYDRNRGELSNLNMTPQNFNLINEVYSQKDNFFNYRMLDNYFCKQDTFTNQILWSKQKISGEDIDTWTNITLASTYDMDGNYGEITSLEIFNNLLLCFQDKALSQLSFNERVQIPTTDGTPIEIGNNYKFEGSIVVSSSIGCQDKWNIVCTPQGVYFLDYNSNSIYLYNGQINNLGGTKGMTWWLRESVWDKHWKPLISVKGIRSFYDSKFSDIYFTPSNPSQEALCYSEMLQEFSSLMSYGGTSAMFNFEDGFYSLRNGTGNTILYQNNVGKYNNFYGVMKGWGFSFIENDNPMDTKVFDTLETRADVYDIDGLLNECPFNFIEVDNEYQYAISQGNNMNMRKKFRVWRGLIPRNMGTRQRIRNPWSKITLGWIPVKPEQSDDNTKKVVVHDVSVKYTV